MQYHLRLSNPRDFQAIYAQGKTWTSKLLILRALPNGTGRNRYGVVTSKRVGKAVRRNRTKRLIREGVRHLHIKGGWDVVFIARAAAAEAEYHQLWKTIADLLHRARLLDIRGQDG